MGIFKNFFNKLLEDINQETQEFQDSNYNHSGSGLNLSKTEAVSKLNMRKDTMTKLCMAKKSLSNIKARVAVVLDYSGSMRDMYESGEVQEILERLLPIALQFDDNGELDMWIFSNGFHRLPSITEEDFYLYVDREIKNNGYHMGGTHYAPVMKDVLREYVKENPENYPSYVIFITDGDNEDKNNTKAIIREASSYNVFWQFVGIGGRDFTFLNELDEMEGRFIDNANFFPIEEISNVSDEELYEKLLHEYPSWEQEAKNKRIIKK